MFWVHHTTHILRAVPFMGGWLADRLFGDPNSRFHPICIFGNIISKGEKALNKGTDRGMKGTILATLLIVCVFGITQSLLYLTFKFNHTLYLLLIFAGVFFCLSGKTLIKEVTAVFQAVDRSTEEGRKQLSRIVGRDTSNLNDQEIRAAALESLAENLSDGVIAPMFWYLLLGLPGMLTYKMINTMDSMIGYKNERYLEFGRAAAKIDDVANYIPARLTAYLMLFVSGNWDKRSFVNQYGKAHTSPNAGYPEAALAAILDCQFGGPHNYFGETIDKPYIGINPHIFTTDDMHTAVQVNSNTELVMGFIVTLILFL